MTPTPFRAKAVKNVENPEQLDQLLTVTDARAWLAIVALALLVMVAAAWSVVGSIPTTVNGIGILVREGGYYPATANASGRLMELRIKPGDAVTAGQVIAVVAQGDLGLQLQQSRDELTRLQRQRTGDAEFAGRELRLQTQRLEAQRDAAAASLAAAERDASDLRARVAELEAGVRAGTILLSELEQQRQVLESAEGSIRQAQVTLRGVDADLASAEQQRQASLRSIDDQIAQVEDRIASLTLRVDEAVQVTSPITGSVVSIEIDENELVQAGEAVALFERTSAPLHALLFTAEQGREAAPSDEAEILPGVVNWEEYGYIRGQVVSVTDAPVTRDYLMRELANETLVQQILSTVGDPYVVRVSLVADSTAPSGFQWTSGVGPQRPITSGMTATGRIVVETQRPIAYLLPIFRKEAGF